jgi:hypothetical protein
MGNTPNLSFPAAEFDAGEATICGAGAAVSEANTNILQSSTENSGKSVNLV